MSLRGKSWEGEKHDELEPEELPDDVLSSLRATGEGEFCFGVPFYDIFHARLFAFLL